MNIDQTLRGVGEDTRGGEHSPEQTHTTVAYTTTSTPSPLTPPHRLHFYHHKHAQHLTKIYASLENIHALTLPHRSKTRTRTHTPASLEDSHTHSHFCIARRLAHAPNQRQRRGVDRRTQPAPQHPCDWTWRSPGQSMAPPAQQQGRQDTPRQQAQREPRGDGRHTQQQCQASLCARRGPDHPH